MKQYGINIYNHDETKPQRKSRSKSRFPLLPNRTFSDCRCQERPTSTPIPCSISVFRMSHSELHHPSHPPNPGMSHFFTPIPHNSRPNNPSHAPPPNSQYRFRGNRKKEKKKNRKFVAMQIFPNDTIRENSYVTRTYVRIYIHTYTHIFYPHRRVQWTCVYGSTNHVRERERERELGPRNFKRDKALFIATLVHIAHHLLTLFPLQEVYRGYW